MNAKLPQYFWVNHKKTNKIEIKNGFLWSPKRTASNHFNQTYENMKKVKPGDIIFSYANGFIQALGYAKSLSYDYENPFENEEQWRKEGWKVDVDFFYIKNKFKPKNYINEIAPLLDEKDYPISGKSGYGIQRCYLANISSALANYLLERINFVEELNAAEELEIVILNQNKEENIIKTSKAVYILQRVGQDIFRNKLIKTFKCCPLTEISLNDLLRASHIKPWSASNNTERLDSANGILLAAHVDILFDKGFISFDSKGNLLTKNEEIDNLLTQMNVKAKNIKLPIESMKYLEWHRNYFKYPK